MLFRNRLIRAVWFAETLRGSFSYSPPPGLTFSSRLSRNFSKGDSGLQKIVSFFSPDFYRLGPPGAMRVPGLSNLLLETPQEAVPKYDESNKPKIWEYRYRPHIRFSVLNGAR